MSERWLPVVGFPNYMVSDEGRIYSHYSQKILRPGIASNGYPTVALGRGNTRTVHSLVAETFIGPCPVGMEVRHKDGKRTNPALKNLCYGTRSDNMQDAKRHGTFNPADPARIQKIVATRDRRDPDWRSKQFQNVDRLANGRKAVETKDRIYGRKNWINCQIAGIPYSTKGGPR
ncbi:MAG: hypothetical protein C0510_06840 [Erythrobacter sp.]|nr:hypothetical protein [Erythrobacter sp.]